MINQRRDLIKKIKEKVISFDFKSIIIDENSKVNFYNLEISRNHL